MSSVIVGILRVPGGGAFLKLEYLNKSSVTVIVIMTVTETGRSNEMLVSTA
jgi:hypothetical protein